MNRVDVFSGLETQSISVEVLREKYAKGDETSIVEIQRRVARALASVEKPKQRARYRALFFGWRLIRECDIGFLNLTRFKHLPQFRGSCFVSGDNYQAGGDAI